jgi:subtilisin family serine protease
MKTEQFKKITTEYFLIKAVLGAIGLLLFFTDNISYIRVVPYISFYFGDASLFKITMLLPLLLVGLSFLVYYGFKKDQEYARLLAIPTLIVDLFSFPLGTILSIVFIGFLVSPYGKYQSIPKGNIGYRGIGAAIIIFSIVGMLFTTGAISNIASTISPMSMDPEAKILSEEPLTGQVQVIIDLDLPTASSFAIQSQDVFIQDVQLMGGDIVDRMFTLDNSILTTIDADKLAELAANPTVKAIIPNTDVWFVPQETTTVLDVGTLDNRYAQLNVEPLWAQGLTGKGVVVAIVDTGINSRLPIFQRDGKSIVIDSLQLNGEYVMWHGTAVASCVASQDDVRKGIAYGASLLNVEVFKANGGADIWSIKKGWDWVAQWKIAHRDTPVICVNSLGANPYLSPGAVILNGYAEKLVTSYNIPMIVAAGNGYATSPVTLHINCPGESKNVLTVGAVDFTGALAGFSCRGVTKDGTKKPDVVAPGVDIPMFDEHGNPKTASGTSFATPLTAGVVALVLQAHPDYSAIQVQDAVKDGADGSVIPHGEKYNTNYGYGLVDAQATLDVIITAKPAQTYDTMIFIIFPLIGAVIFFIPELKKRKW